MAQITEPPVIPNLSLPVPSRLNPEPFSERMDRTLLEIPLTVDGINLTVSWTYDTAQLVKGFSQAAAQSVQDAAQQVELAKQEVLLAKGEVGLAKQEVQLAKDEVTNAAGFAQESANSAAASEQARFDISQIIDTLTGELGLPDNGLVGAPIVKTAEGVAFDVYQLGRQSRVNNDAFSFTQVSCVAQPYQVLTIDTSLMSAQGEIAVTLPDNPEVGDWVRFRDGAGTWTSRPPVVLRNGHKIMGKNKDLKANVRHGVFTLTFFGLNEGWVIS